MKTESSIAAPPVTSSADDRGLAVADQLAIGAKRAGEGAPQAGLVRPAFRRRHRVAIGVEESVAIDRPGDRPFGATLAVGEIRLPGERRRGHHLAAVDGRGEIIAEAAGEMQRVAGRRVVAFGDEAWIAGPADLDPAEEIGLGAAHAIEPRRLEMRLLAEDLRVGVEFHRGAAAVDGAGILQLPLRRAALVVLHEELLVARDLDDEIVGERVHHREADAVQPARGLVDLAAELAARMQRGEDDFQRRLVLVLGMRVDRDAAAVVADRHVHIGAELDLDPAGMAGDGLVHGVVEHFGDQVMQRPLVGAADIHARPTADRLQALQNLDILGRIVAALPGRVLKQIVAHVPPDSLTLDRSDSRSGAWSQSESRLEKAGLYI
jgi:hypothetical protein